MAVKVITFHYAQFVNSSAAGLSSANFLEQSTFVAIFSFLTKITQLISSVAIPLVSWLRFFLRGQV